MSQIQELEALAEAFESKAKMLREMADQLGYQCYPLPEKSLRTAKKGRRKMSAAAKAKISKKLKAAWKVRKQIREQK